MSYSGVTLNRYHILIVTIYWLSACGGSGKTITGWIYFGLICADIAANTLNRALEADKLAADD